MNLQAGSAWALGMLVLLLAVFLVEITVVFDDVIYHRVGINREFLSIILWALVFGAAFTSSYFSSKYKLIIGLSYMLIFPLFAAVGRYLNGELGGAVDFTGLSGAVVYFKVNLVLGSFLIVLGTFSGFAISLKRNKTLNDQ